MTNQINTANVTLVLGSCYTATRGNCQLTRYKTVGKKVSWRIRYGVDASGLAAGGVQLCATKREALALWLAM